MSWYPCPECCGTEDETCQQCQPATAPSQLQIAVSGFASDFCTGTCVDSFGNVVTNCLCSNWNGTHIGNFLLHNTFSCFWLVQFPIFTRIPGKNTTFLGSTVCTPFTPEIWVYPRSGFKDWVVVFRRSATGHYFTLSKVIPDPFPLNCRQFFNTPLTLTIHDLDLFNPGSAHDGTCNVEKVTVVLSNV